MRLRRKRSAVKEARAGRWALKSALAASSPTRAKSGRASEGRKPPFFSMHGEELFSRACVCLLFVIVVAYVRVAKFWHACRVSRQGGLRNAYPCHCSPGGCRLGICLDPLTSCCNGSPLLELMGDLYACGFHPVGSPTRALTSPPPASGLFRPVALPRVCSR